MNGIVCGVNVAFDLHVVSFVAFHCIGILDCPSLAVLVSGDALAVITDLAFEARQSRSTFVLHFGGALRRALGCCGLSTGTLICAWLLPHILSNGGER